MVAWTNLNITLYVLCLSCSIKIKGTKTKGVKNKLKMSYSVYILPFQKDNLNCHQQKHFLKVQITKLTSQAIWSQLKLLIKFAFHTFYLSNYNCLICHFKPNHKQWRDYFKLEINAIIFIGSYSWQPIHSCKVFQTVIYLSLSTKPLWPGGGRDNWNGVLK
jgi:hypothetical protein